MFKDWNYKKHAAFVSGIYLGLWAIDMTLGYMVAKKAFAKMEEQKKLKFFMKIGIKQMRKLGKHILKLH